MTDNINNSGIGRFAKNIHNIGRKNNGHQQAVGAAPKEEKPANESTNLNNDPRRINGLYIVKKAETKNGAGYEFDPEKVKRDAEDFRENAGAIIENAKILEELQAEWAKDGMDKAGADLFTYLIEMGASSNK